MRPLLIVLGGPTASGKTALAIRLAKALGTEIVSADSRQFYREMRIGTAKPTPAELAEVRHHFIDSLSIHEPYSVGDFERDALALLDDLFLTRETAVLTGGSGLFIRALTEGLDRFPPISDAARKHVAEGEQTGGIAWLQAELQRRDPAQFEKIDALNPARLRRALEVCVETGMPYSSFLTAPRAERPFDTLSLLLDPPRPILYERINQRVDGMIEEGLEEEARALYPFRRLTALNTVGYEEWFEHFDGLIARETAIDKIKQHTRNYAKRQVTWFSKYGDWTRIDADQTDAALQIIADRLDFLRK